VLQTSTDRVFSRVGGVNRALRCPHARRQISSKFHRTVYARTQRRHWPPARAIYSQNFVVVVVVVVHSQTRCRRRSSLGSRRVIDACRFAWRPQVGPPYRAFIIRSLARSHYRSGTLRVALLFSALRRFGVVRATGRN